MKRRFSSWWLETTLLEVDTIVFRTSRKGEPHFATVQWIADLDGMSWKNNKTQWFDNQNTLYMDRTLPQCLLLVDVIDEGAQIESSVRRFRSIQDWPENRKLFYQPGGIWTQCAKSSRVRWIFTSFWAYVDRGDGIFASLSAIYLWERGNYFNHSLERCRVESRGVFARLQENSRFYCPLCEWLEFFWRSS